MERTMKIFVICATATLAVATFPWTPVQAAYSQRGVVLDSFGRLIWCGNSGYDNGPPRERAPVPRSTHANSMTHAGPTATRTTVSTDPILSIASASCGGRPLALFFQPGPCRCPIEDIAFDAQPQPATVISRTKGGAGSAAVRRHRSNPRVSVPSTLVP
jgi:hypothetical protein